MQAKIGSPRRELTIRLIDLFYFATTNDKPELVCYKRYHTGQGGASLISVFARADRQQIVKTAAAVCRNVRENSSITHAQLIACQSFLRRQGACLHRSTRSTEVDKQPRYMASAMTRQQVHVDKSCQHIFSLGDASLTLDGSVTIKEVIT